jgi:hypothetical protein
LAHPEAASACIAGDRHARVATQWDFEGPASLSVRRAG